MAPAQEWYAKKKKKNEAFLGVMVSFQLLSVNAGLFYLKE